MSRAEFGPLLRRLREEAGITMGALARHLGVAVPYLSDVERQKRPPLSKERIKAAARLLKIKTNQLNRLLGTAADWQGFFELGADVSPQGKRTGAALARGWENLSDSSYEKIRRVIEEENPNGQVSR